jgi:hypothetical protein
MTEQDVSEGEARHALGLLAIGYHPGTVAREVGLSEEQVEAIAREHGPKPDVSAREAPAEAVTTGSIQNSGGPPPAEKMGLAGAPAVEKTGPVEPGHDEKTGPVADPGDEQIGAVPARRHESGSVQSSVGAGALAREDEKKPPSGALASFATTESDSSAEQPKLSPQRAAIVDLLERCEEPMKPAAVAEALGMEGGNARYLLHRMVKDGQVQKTVYGKYSVGRINNTDETNETNAETAVPVESVGAHYMGANEAHSATTGVATATRLTAEERIAKRKARLGSSGVTKFDASTGGSISWEEDRRRKGYPG